MIENETDEPFSYVEWAITVAESIHNGQRTQAYEQMERCKEKAAMLDYAKSTLGVHVAYNMALCYFAQKERHDA